MTRLKPNSFWRSLSVSWGILLFFCLAIVSFSRPVLALDVITNTANHILATVKDHTVPSAVILISPLDVAQVISQRPTFSWYASTDDVGVSYYQVFIDGQVFLNNIPINSIETSSFKSVVDGIENTLSVTPKTAIPDGLHNWKVVVFDAAGNSNTSATWLFTIDSQAPSFVLVQIGNIGTNISAQDSSTWPTKVIEITDNPARLAAAVEAQSHVVATVIWDDVVKQTITTDSNSEGVWIELLGILPKGKDITLNFLVTDKFGLTSILQNVKFKIVDVIAPILGSNLTPTPTLTPTAMPIPTSVKPSPTYYPGQPTSTPTPTTSPTPTLLPTQPAPSPTPPISTLATGFLDWNWPGGQIASKTTLPWVQEVILNISLNLPPKIAEPIQQIVATPPSEQPFWWSIILPSLYLIGLVLAWVWWYWRWHKAWIETSWSGWWGILGFLRPKELGILLNFEVNDSGVIIGQAQPLKFAKILVMGRNSTDRAPKLIETIFSDQNGQFSLPKWPDTKQAGSSFQYSFQIMTLTKSGPKILEFCQPLTTWPKPFTPYAYWHHQYYGGWLSLKQSLAFPTLAIMTQSQNQKTQILVKLNEIIGSKMIIWSRVESSWLPGIAILSMLICSIWGGWFNWLSLIILLIVWSYKEYLKRLMRTWQIRLPVSMPVGMWCLVTTQADAIKCWWNHTCQVTDTTKHLLLTVEIPKKISSVRITPLQSKQNLEMYCPETWELNWSEKILKPKLTNKIECISKSLRK